MSKQQKNGTTPHLTCVVKEEEWTSPYYLFPPIFFFQQIFIFTYYAPYFAHARIIYFCLVFN